MPGKRWTQKDRDSLIRQVKRGRSLPQISIRGRSPAAVNQQRQRLRDSGELAQHPKRELRAWTMKQIRLLADYSMSYGLSAAEIAAKDLLPGRSKDSISQQMRRRGLGDPKRRRTLIGSAWSSARKCGSFWKPRAASWRAVRWLSDSSWLQARSRLTAVG